METNNSLSCVGLYVQEVISYFKAQKFLLIEDIYKDIYTNFIARIISNNFDLVICSFLLSPGGRVYFHKRYKTSVDFYNETEKCFQYPPLFDKEKEFDDAKNQLFLHNSMQNPESEEIDIFQTEPVSEKDESSQLFCSYKDNYDILNIDLFDNMFSITETVITNLAKILEINIENILDLLDKYLLKATAYLPLNLDVR